MTFSVRSNPTKTEEEVKSCCLLFSHQGASARLDGRSAMQAGLQLRSWQTGRMWGIESIEKKRSGFERVQDRVRAKEWQDFLVAMRLGATPVPIPNTMVKTQTADGTALETVWESRWPPNLKEKSKGRSAAGVKNKYGQRWATTYHRQPNQQGSAVLITGFTSD